MEVIITNYREIKKCSFEEQPFFRSSIIFSFVNELLFIIMCLQACNYVHQSLKK
jgi:hypothetical protein